MRDIRSILLLLLSFGLVATWVYHLYDKTIYTRTRNEVFIRDSAAVADGVRDSLTRMFDATVRQMDARLDSSRINTDSLESTLSDRLAVINQLKGEIGTILNKRTMSETDLSTARQKINELQGKVNELRNQNLSMEDEKKQLASILGQLGKTADSLQQNIRRLSDENAVLNAKVSQASIFVASEIRLEAIDVRGSREESTGTAKKADKFIVSLIVQNNVNQYDNAEVSIVIVQPDNKVLQNSNWNSGTLDTPEGKKAYTRSIRFDYAKSERKELSFSIDPEDFLKGNYMVQVWHKGVLIGSASLQLG